MADPEAPWPCAQAATPDLMTRQEARTVSTDTVFVHARPFPVGRTQSLPSSQSRSAPSEELLRGQAVSTEGTRQRAACLFPAQGRDTGT